MTSQVIEKSVNIAIIQSQAPVSRGFFFARDPMSDRFLRSFENRGRQPSNRMDSAYQQGAHNVHLAMTSQVIEKSVSIAIIQSQAPARRGFFFARDPMSDQCPRPVGNGGGQSSTGSPELAPEPSNVMLARYYVHRLLGLEFESSTKPKITCAPVIWQYAHAQANDGLIRSQPNLKGCHVQPFFVSRGAGLAGVLG
ncbi:TPA: hypothetical protein ACXIMI_001670 [Stenotrophomonas maltophilia]